jgi:hypothetical protein
MGPLEAAVLRGIVVPQGNNDKSENLVLRGSDKRPRERGSLDLFSGCILLMQLSVAPKGEMCRESGRGTQTRLYSFRIHIVSLESSSTSRNHIVCYTCSQIGTFYPDTGVAYA